MPHTVAALFESESQAQQARAELMDLGIPIEDIFIRYDTGQAERTDEHGVSGFFKRLFGFENDEDRRTSYYSQAIGAGHYLVAVDAPTEDQAERAADLMQRLGAIDIDDDIDDLDISPTGAGLGAQSGAAPMNRGGVRVYARRYQLSADEKSGLRGRHEDIDSQIGSARTTGRPGDAPASAPRNHGG